MPKLQGIEDKYINGIKVDKENKDVFFNDETHKYYDKKTMQPYISVTQIVGKYSQEFDENFWSSYKALEAILEGDVFSIIKPLLLSTKRFDNRLLSKYNIDEKVFQEKKNEILLEYKTKRDEACEHGTNEHLKKELSFYNRSNFDFHKYGFDEAGEFECRENYYTLDLENGVYPEFLIAINYKGLRLSGQVDLMIKRGNNICICDWKTNREIKKVSYYDKNKKSNVMMKYPLNNLMDVNYWHYAMQLSTYAFMCQQINPDFQIEKLNIVHIDRDGKETIYPIEYRKQEVERMLNHYIKHQKIQAELDEDKPIEI